MSFNLQTGIGHAIKLVTGIAPLNNAAGTVDGTGVDRTGFHSLVVDAEVGTLEGTPTTVAVDVKVQHSDTLGSGYTDFKPEGTAASGAVAQITAASTRKRKSINLDGAKKYIRVEQVVAFTGGSTPKANTAVVLVLGGAIELPAQADD